MRFRFETALQFVTALVLAAAAGPPCPGQERNGGPLRPLPEMKMREMQRTADRDILFREQQKMAEHGGTAPAPHARRLALAQINEDFTRIQVVNHRLARASAGGNGLDFKLVAQAASEIRRRAGRLKDNLALPERAPNEPRPGTAADEVGPGQLKAALTTLDGLVHSFVKNPVFQRADVLDAEWSVKARRDLEAIIELSGRVKACGEQLHKAAQKAH